MQPAGIYIAIPFCKAKCSFCNFASGVFAEDRMQAYVDRVCNEICSAHQDARRQGVSVPAQFNSIYFGGGTPSLLPPGLVEQLFSVVRSQFNVLQAAEITVECAPGQVSAETLASFQANGMNRASFGVQSFVDSECAAVGRLHTAQDCHTALRQMKAAGVDRLALDLIAGLPHQTESSWRYTVDQAITSGVEHISLYMLEVDEDSRLGREAIAGGTRYGAARLPSDDDVADWYASACGWLAEAGFAQYEISNFAKVGGQSRHNRKYWERTSYLGFGLDAHSMLRTPAPQEAIRWANPDEMDAYRGTSLIQLSQPPAVPLASQRTIDLVNQRQAFEESLFLGLRLVEGVDMNSLPASLTSEILPSLADCEEAGLLTRTQSRLQLTSRGRMLSNEVFSRLLLPAERPASQPILEFA